MVKSNSDHGDNQILRSGAKPSEWLREDPGHYPQKQSRVDFRQPSETGTSACTHDLSKIDNLPLLPTERVVGRV